MSKNAETFRKDFDGKDTTLEKLQGYMMSITNPSCTNTSVYQQFM